MNLAQFIQKYSLFNTFYPSDLSDAQLKELESCSEFSNVKKFNSVDCNDKFFINNAIDFPIVKLKSNTVFNYKINLHSINVIGPFPTHDVYQMNEGLTEVVYCDETSFKEHCAIIFKFEIEKLKDVFLSDQEVGKHIQEEMNKAFNEHKVSQKKYYLIGVRVHKDSILQSKGNGEDVKIYTSDTNETKFFK